MRRGPTGFAKELPGEPPVAMKQGDGLYYADRSRPIYTVSMDAGVFEHMWRTAEAQHKTAHQHGIPAYEDLIQRAVLSFRECRQQTIEDVKAPVLQAKKIVRRPKVVVKRKPKK